MPAFLKGKKFILCAVALLLAAVATIVAVSFTYAAYRRDVMSEGGATVAGAVAEYKRGNAKRNNDPVEIVDTQGTLTVSELSPGDLFYYDFSVNNFTDGADVKYNEVLLKITCEFTFTYAYMADGGKVEYQSLSAVADDSSHPDIIFSFAEKGAEDLNEIEAQTGTSPVYYDPQTGSPSDIYVVENAENKENEENKENVQRIGFYLYPASAGSTYSQRLGFTVQVPAQSASSGEYDEDSEFRLNISLKIIAEQELETEPGQTG